MLPEIWIIDMYTLLIIIGVVLGLLLVFHIGKKFGLKRKYVYDLLLNAILSITVGLLSASLAQYIFNLIGGHNEFEGMTFYGGLIGGALTFIIVFFTVIKRIHKDDAYFMDCLVIAPVIITLCHAFGRIGCFCAGCCYGVETDSFLGVQFPGMHYKVYPTQLFESAFLFLLTGVLYLLTVKYRNKNTMPIYMISYGIWRFVIEFIRGDDRGGNILGLSPAQFISIFVVLGGIVLLIVYRKIEYPKKQYNIDNTI